MMIPSKSRAFAVLSVIALLALLAPNVAWSMGKNGGGALYIHFDPTINFIPDDVPASVYFNQFSDACPAIDPADCELAYQTACHYGADCDPDLNPMFPTPRYIKWICAVFPETTCVEIAEIFFEQGPITGTVDMFAWGTYHPEAGAAGTAYGITSGDFPHTWGTNCHLFFDPPLTGHVVPICYIAGAPAPNGTTSIDLDPVWFKDAAGNQTFHVDDPDCPRATGFWLIPGGGGCNPSLGDDPYMHVCCFFSGHCEISNEEDCALSGGEWYPEWDSCDPNPCETPVRACCTGPEQQWVCTEVTEEECNAGGGQWFASYEFCDPDPCAGPYSVCCYQNDECWIFSELMCDAFGGAWLEDYTSCDPNPCVAPVAACCFEGPAEFTCQPMFEPDCWNAGGVWIPGYPDCDPNPCEGTIAACCLDIDGYLDCELFTEPMCIASNGSWHSEWTSCDPNPCNGPLAACCSNTDELNCDITNQNDCINMGGEWLAGVTSCDPDPCNSGPFGACCIESGPLHNCFIYNELECEVEDGEWHPEWTSCDPNPCNGEIGACCYYDDYLDCTIAGEDWCALMGGLFLVGVESCDPDPCNVGLEAACCYGGPGDDLSCIVTTLNECDYLGGEWIEQWDFCDPDPCGATLGACCYMLVDELDCAIMDELDCVEGNFGVWFGDQPCDPGLCAQGVCCTDENCAVMILSECQSAEGIWFPELTSCDGAPCNLRACCYAVTAECTITYEMECDGLDLDWHADIASCDPNPCDPYGPRRTCCIGPNCTIVTEVECISSGGIWDAGLSTCRPVNPCTQTLVRACCINDVCSLTTMEACDASQGEWLSYSESCVPDPCGGIVTGSRACCFDTGGCLLMEEEPCGTAGGVWIAGMVSCSGGDLGNPCRLRACCDGLQLIEARLMRRDECETLGGDWLPDIGYLEPDPCEAGTPVRDASWGKIKSLYRPAK